MRMVDLISKKRDGHELTTEEISFFIDGYTNGTIPDYQASADPTIGLATKTTAPTIGAKRCNIYRIAVPTIGNNVITPLPVNYSLKRIAGAKDKHSYDGN